MGSSVFQAAMWLKSENVQIEHKPTSMPTQKSAVHPLLPTFKSSKSIDLLSEGFAPHRCFIPGWSGDSLGSKNLNKFSSKISIIHQDVKASLALHSGFNRGLKTFIYQDFLNFLEHKAINNVVAEDLNKFWNDLFDEENKDRETYSQYLEIYSYRVSLIYLHKLRFIKRLQEEISTGFDIKYAYYPTAFLTSIFKKGSSFELKSKALESNLYSWYKPSETLQSHLLELADLTTKLDSSEFHKVSSILQSEILQDNEASYSHALSHINFGLFLNSILINFPTWLSSVENEQHEIFRSKKVEIISAKFDGDYLESLSKSHWLAQLANRHIPWDQILCSDFKSHDFSAGPFFKLANELEFLTVLIDIAKSQHKAVIPYLCDVMNGHYQNKKESANVQKVLLAQDNFAVNSTYNRIVVNLNHYPKNNSQHFLINKIQGQLSLLKQSGKLFVLSSKKLFVPSQKSKIDTLLEKLHLDSIIDLSEVQGKGEVGNYIYIFSKLNHAELFTTDKRSKKTCYSFRFKGELQTFHQFSGLTELIHNFFANHMDIVSAMYRKETESGLSLEFFQDAIIDGRLVQSSTPDSGKITHPTFFNNIMKSYAPFDFFFDLYNIDMQNTQVDESPLFSFGENQIYRNYDTVIIVDKRDQNITKLELIPITSLESKYYYYGQTQCFYFGIRPKRSAINLNTLNDFFQTKIGHQIIHLSFNHENRKIKSHLSKMMVPKFIVEDKPIPNHIKQGIDFLYYNENQLMDMGPIDIALKFSQIKNFISELSKNYPAAMLGTISRFKSNLTACSEFFGQSQINGQINFNNHLIKTALMKGQKKAIYPNNNEIYLEFTHSDLNGLHLSLTGLHFFTKNENGPEIHGLELHSNDKIILKIYSSKEMLRFLEFLLPKTFGMPLSKILQGVQVPSLDDLMIAINTYNSMQEKFKSILDQIDPMIDNITNQAALIQ